MLDRYLEPEAFDDADPRNWMTPEELEEFLQERDENAAYYMEEDECHSRISRSFGEN